MQCIFQDVKKGIVKLKITNLDDLWYLSHILTPKDRVKSRTYRKIKLGAEGERNTKIIKKSIALEIEVEKVEFHKTLNILRVSGKTVDALEEIPKGSFHTLSLEPDSIVTITKVWLVYQKEKLLDSLKETRPNLLICVLDREEATLAIIKQFGFEIITELTGEVQKKAYDTKETKNFYKEIKEVIEQADKKYQPEHIIIASPAFWKEEVVKEIKDPLLKKKVVVATCNTSGKSGVQEVLKRDELKTILKEEKIAKETKLVEQILKELSTEGKATYGIKEVEDAVSRGAVELLLVTDRLIHKTREENTYEQLDNIMKAVDQQKGTIHIISSEHESGERLDGLTGIAALLRFKEY